MSKPINVESFKGIFTPILMPVTNDYDGVIDVPRLRRHVSEIIERGVDATSVRAGCGTSLPERANALAFNFKEEHEVRAQIQYVLRDRPDVVIEKGDVRGKDGAPDWDALKADAVSLARESTTSNECGFLDSFWESHLKSDFDAGKLKDVQKNDNLLMAPTEDSDLALALDVARQGGIDLLCVLLPWAGAWEDYRGLSQV